MGSLTLLQLRGIGTKTADKLVRTYLTLQAIKEAAEENVLERLLRKVPASLLDENAIEAALRKADQIIKAAARYGVSILTVYDAEYPKLLSRIEDRPLVLYVKGHL